MFVATQQQVTRNNTYYMVILGFHVQRRLYRKACEAALDQEGEGGYRPEVLYLLLLQSGELL